MVRLFSLVLTILLLLQTSRAQLAKMSIIGKPEKSDTDIITRKDVNGRFCAAIQVVSDMDGFQYEAYNGVVHMEDKPGTDIVYLQPDERVLEIYHSGYEKLKIILNDAGINLHSRELWTIKIEGQAPYYSGKGYLEIITDPAGADINIDGIPGFTKNSPFVYEKLNAQTWKFIISKENYKPLEELITVKKGQSLTKKFKLTPTFGYITINSNVPGADLYINDMHRIFENGKPLAVPVGDVRIRLTKKYYRDFEHTLDIAPNDKRVNSLPVEAKMIRQEGTLSVQCSVSEVQVYLDGYLIGSAPLTKTVQAGNHNIQCRKNGYRSESASVQVLGGKTLQKHFNMTQNALVSISGTNGASVYIDGRLKGILPLDNLEVEPGDHKISVQKEGYDTESGSFSAKSERKKLSYNLTLTRGKFMRFSLFGNQRVSDLTNGLSLAFGGYSWQIPADLVRNAVTVESDLSMNSINETGFDFEGAIVVTPFVIGGSGRGYTTALGVTSTEDDSLRTRAWFGHLGLIPFVIKERLYPSAGVFYGSGQFTYLVGSDKRKKINKPIYGFYYDLRFNFNEMFFIKFRYMKIKNNAYFNDSLRFQLGMMIGPKSQKKKKTSSTGRRK